MNRMRPIRETISLEAARELIDGAVRPIERTERVRIDAASGRVVARPVEARADVPPFARAAMDGYAVRAADTVGASTHDPRVLAWVHRTEDAHRMVGLLLGVLDHHHRI